MNWCLTLASLLSKEEPKVWSQGRVYLRDGDHREFAHVRRIYEERYSPWLTIVTTTSFHQIRANDVEGYDLID